MPLPRDLDVNEVSGAGPRYLCDISSALMRISSPKLRMPAEFALDSQVALGRNTVQVLRMNLASGGMKIDTTGSVFNLFSPQLDFDVTQVAPLQDLNKLVKTPLESRGDIWFQGHVTSGGSSTDRFTGKLTTCAPGGFVHTGRRHPEYREWFADADFTLDKINLTDLQLSSPDGRFHGTVRLNELERISVKGEMEEVTIAEVGRLAARETGSLNGTLSGRVQLDGRICAFRVGWRQRQRRGQPEAR